MELDLGISVVDLVLVREFRLVLGLKLIGLIRFIRIVKCKGW